MLKLLVSGVQFLTDLTRLHTCSVYTTSQKTVHCNRSYFVASQHKLDKFRIFQELKAPFRVPNTSTSCVCSGNTKKRFCST